MKSWKVIAPVLALVALVAVGTWVAQANADDSANELKIASLVNEMDTMAEDDFYSLEPISIERYTIPPDSVDVMRARVSETYSVDGIGEDTVELRGWIAVKHYNARPAAGQAALNWQTAVVDTEFVGMDLQGFSKKFGPVQVTLNPDVPSRGQVGRIQIPFDARTMLVAELNTDDSVGGRAAAADEGGEEQSLSSTSGSSEREGELELETTAIDAAFCEAPLVAQVTMPDLGLQMKTKGPVVWYSMVDTIPPVGHTASIAIEPVRLESEGREVATLINGKVQFREVVRTVVLDASADVKVASN